MYEPPTGDGANDESNAPSMNDKWIFFDVIHKYASGKHNFHPPYLISSTDGENMHAETVNIDHEETLYDSHVEATSTPQSPLTPDFSDVHSSLSNESCSSQTTQSTSSQN